jgi:small subunit ribosomal protein S20
MAAPTKKKKRSTLKRIRQNVRRRAQNRLGRSAARTAVRRAREATSGATDGAAELLREAQSLLDRAAKRGAIHPNSARRRKSRLARAARAATS